MIYYIKNITRISDFDTFLFILSNAFCKLLCKCYSMRCFEISQSQPTLQTASNCLGVHLTIFRDETSCARAFFGNTMIHPIYLAQCNSQPPIAPLCRTAAVVSSMWQSPDWQSGAASLPHPGSNPSDNSGLHRKNKVWETETLKGNDSNNRPFAQAEGASLTQVCTSKPKGRRRVFGCVVANL